MKLVYQSFEAVPVGIVPSILDTIRLAGEIQQEVYTYAAPSIDNFELSSSVIKEHWEVVNIALTYYVADDMEHSFQVFVEKYVNKLLSDNEHLKLCWRIAND